MKTMVYDNRVFWMITGVSAVRPHGFDRLEILTWEPDGEVQYKSRTAMPSLLNVVKSTFRRAGLE